MQWGMESDEIFEYFYATIDELDDPCPNVERGDRSPIQSGAKLNVQKD